MLALWITLGVLGVVKGAICAAAWALAGQATRRRAPDPPDPPERYGLRAEPARFTARDGLQLSGRLVGSLGQPVIVFCAGINGNMDGDTGLVPPLVEAGFAVFQFDWRAHGESEGERCSLGLHERLDLLGALDHLEGRGVPRVGLLGFSMGGAVALRTAAEDPRAACVVCDGGFVETRHAIEGALRQRTGRPLRAFAALVLAAAGLQSGGRLAQASPLGYAPRIAPRPVLLIHGAEDPYVPPDAQAAIHAACGPGAVLWQVPGCGHREAARRLPREYQARVVNFFRQHLLQQSSTTNPDLV